MHCPICLNLGGRSVSELGFVPIPEAHIYCPVCGYQGTVVDFCCAEDNAQGVIHSPDGNIFICTYNTGAGYDTTAAISVTVHQHPMLPDTHVVVLWIVEFGNWIQVFHMPVPADCEHVVAASNVLGALQAQKSQFLDQAPVFWDTLNALQATLAAYPR